MKLTYLDARLGGNDTKGWGFSWFGGGQGDFFERYLPPVLVARVDGQFVIQILLVAC